MHKLLGTLYACMRCISLGVYS